MDMALDTTILIIAVMSLLASSLNIFLNSALLRKFPTIRQIRDLLVSITDHIGIKYDANGRIILPDNLLQFSGFGGNGSMIPPGGDIGDYQALQKENKKLRNSNIRLHSSLDKLRGSVGEEPPEEIEYELADIDWNLIDQFKNHVGINGLDVQNAQHQQLVLSALNSRPDLAKAYEAFKSLGGVAGSQSPVQQTIDPTQFPPGSGA